MTTQTIYYCPDCGKPLNEEYYDRPNGKSYSTYTCKTSDCLLTWVTLSWDVWESKVADGSIEAYREMNRKNLTA
jgi:hypothetical protein